MAKVGNLEIIGPIGLIQGIDENTYKVVEGHGVFYTLEAVDKILKYYPGWRLCLRNEMANLVNNTGRTLDDDRQGFWIGEDSSLQENSSKSIYVPRAGYCTSSGRWVNTVSINEGGALISVRHDVNGTNRLAGIGVSISTTGQVINSSTPSSTTYPGEWHCLYLVRDV